MHIQTVNYTRTFNLGNYSSEKIGVEFALNEGESANKALDYARELVEEYHAENVKRLKELRDFCGIGDSYQEEINERIPTQSKQTLVEKTKSFIDICKTKEELKAWELMSKSNPELLQHYNNKLKTL
jgi:hypothetical protein